MERRTLVPPHLETMRDIATGNRDHVFLRGWLLGFTSLSAYTLVKIMSRLHIVFCLVFKLGELKDTEYR